MLSIIQKELRKHKGTSLDADRCACYHFFVESDCEAFFLKNPGQKADTIIHELRGAYAGTTGRVPALFAM